MPDISEYLDIIANEPKGRLVKQAIHDALNVINAAADKRPVAMTGVPIDEVIIDTGWITDARIGELIAGEVLSLDGEVAETTEESDVFTGSAALLLQEGGRAFFVTVDDGGTSISDIPTISDDAELTWTLVSDITVPVSKFSTDSTPIALLYPDANIRGFVYGEENLPDPTGYSVNDVIVDNIDYDGAGGYTYVCTNDGSVNEWTKIEEAPMVLCNDDKQLHLHIWTAEVPTLASLTVTAELESEMASFMSVGLFVAYGSNTNYNVCDINHSGRAYSISKNNFKGRVTGKSDLPETVTNGDLYYISSLDAVYKGIDGEWVRMSNVYESYIDSKVYSGDNDGLHPGTQRLFLFIGYDPSVRSPHFDYVPGSSSTATARFYKSTGNGTRLTAFHQCAPDGGNYPSFKPKEGNEKYFNLNDGSVAVVTIEIGGGLT